MGLEIFNNYKCDGQMEMFDLSNPPDRNFGRLLREERMKQKVSQYQLAQKAGVTKRSIAYWESGTKKMSLESADKVFKALHVSVVIGER